MSDPNRDTRYFRPLQQTAFMQLEHAASQKGLLKPFKGKGDLEAWASQCFAMRGTAPWSRLVAISTTVAAR